jgi:hypothetical protein
MIGYQRPREAKGEPRRALVDDIRRLAMQIQCELTRQGVRSILHQPINPNPKGWLVIDIRDNINSHLFSLSIGSDYVDMHYGYEEWVTFEYANPKFPNNLYKVIEDIYISRGLTVIGETNE